MKTNINKRLKNLFIVMSIIMITIPMNGHAQRKFVTGDDAQLIYQSQSANHNIYGYVSKLMSNAVSEPRLVYVNQAYGPAIHSYAHSGKESTVSWNANYVDTAYGQAIYSYESVQTKKTVKLLPIVIY